SLHAALPIWSQDLSRRHSPLGETVGSSLLRGADRDIRTHVAGSHRLPSPGIRVPGPPRGRRSMSEKRSGLGKGLSALIPSAAEAEATYRAVGPDEIRPNPRQPRRIFDDLALEELAASITEVGVLQPLVVSEAEDGGYILLAGERRLRASRLAGLASVPVVVRPDMGEERLLSDALVENSQREQLRPLEEAAAYQELVD